MFALFKLFTFYSGQHFIQSTKGSQFGYLILSIAKHWGVIVGNLEKLFYCLVFEDQPDIVSDANLYLNWESENP